MPVHIKLDGVLARRKITGRDLAARINVSETQLSLFKSGKVKGVRFSTLARLCAALECEPGDLIGYTFDPKDLGEEDPEAEDEGPTAARTSA